MAFKQAQWLPTLTSELLVNTNPKMATSDWQTTKPSLAKQKGPAQSQSARLPQPETSVPVSERVVFAIVALSAAVGAGQAFATIVSTSPGWPMLGARVGALLG